MKRCIVFTTIQAPTDAVKRWAEQPGWEVISVGDRKTPENWSCPGCVYLPATYQSSLAKMLPWDHYSRKMLGYIHAMESGAELILDTDDDNFPHPGWSDFDLEIRERTVVESTNVFLNIYRAFTDEPCWPRGYPLELITQDGSLLVRPDKSQIGVWQGLVSDDPDMDAIYRLTTIRRPVFDAGRCFVLAPGTLCPFNSQNTVFRRELFPLLYLPVTVSFRFTDILRGYVALAVMRHTDYRIEFRSPNARQERNPHKYMDDFRQEVSMYLNTLKVTELVRDAMRSGNSISENLYSGYAALAREGIVEPTELTALIEWQCAVQEAVAVR
jgi:hypothetical protein